LRTHIEPNRTELKTLQMEPNPNRILIFSVAGNNPNRNQPKQVRVLSHL